jgi:transposase-like protein
VTAGTVFHTTRTPLTVWFEAAWLMMTSKQGVSALELQRVTEVGSYQTAWTILHKLRLATSSTGREALTGRVEVDEALFGGLSPGFSGRSLEKKALVAAAIERRGTRRFGRARLQVIPNASAASLTDFLRTAVTAGSTIITDGWRSYPDTAARLHLIHEAHKIGPSGEPAHVALPGVHRLFSLSKRVLEGTYQGGVQREHLQAYLDEYIFRFNRRTAKHRGLLFLRLLEHAVGAIPTRYRDLVAIHREMTSEHRPIARTHSHPTTLTGDHIDRPWRAA